MLSGNAGIATEWVLCGLALFCVVTRIVVRFIIVNARYNSSDIFIATAWVALAATVASDTILNKYGLMAPGRTFDDDILTVSDDPGVLVSMLKIIYGSAISYYVCLWFTKFSLLAFYFTIITPTLPTMRKALWFVTTGVVITFLAVLCFNLFWCIPVPRNWSLTRDNVCIAFSSHPVVFVSVACNVVSDLAIFILPFPLLRKLQIPRRERIGVIAIFSMGAVCIIIAVARIVALAFSATTIEVSVWSQSELCAGLIVACLPALRVFFRTKGNTSHAGSSRTWGRAPSHPSQALASSRSPSWLMKTLASRSRDEEDQKHLSPGLRAGSTASLSANSHEDRELANYPKIKAKSVAIQIPKHSLGSASHPKDDPFNKENGDLRKPESVARTTSRKGSESLVETTRYSDEMNMERRGGLSPRRF